MIDETTKVADFRGGIILLAFIAIAGFKSAMKVKNFVDKTKSELAILAEENSPEIIRQIDVDLTRRHQVLCLGNSITLHPELEEVFWYSHHGMAASKPETDYVHRLERMMKMYNDSTSVDALNIWTWERQLTACNLDSLLSKPLTGKDICIIRIGENIKEKDAAVVEKAFVQLVDYVKQRVPTVILTGQFWQKSPIEHACLRAARECHVAFVPLWWIYASYEDEVRPHVGDTIYDTKGQPYTIKTDFICTHPNDRGMRMIAESIFAAMR